MRPRRPPKKKTKNEESAAAAAGMSMEEEENQMVERSEKVAAYIREDFESWLEQQLCENDVTALIFYRGLFWYVRNMQLSRLSGYNGPEFSLLFCFAVHITHFLCSYFPTFPASSRVT